MKTSLALYSTAAQIIPLFLGFLAFELRAFAADEALREAGKTASSFTVATCVLLICLLALGEFAAIHVLARGAATKAARSAVLTAMFAGGLLLTLGIIESSVGSLFRSRPGTMRIASSTVLIFAISAWLLLS